MTSSSSKFANPKPDVTAAPPRRVLVLEGGGAKGAYAFGCMLAFARANIQFNAVAGTSVGALNAILWCTNSMSAGTKLWRSISFESVYPVRFCDPKEHSRIVVSFLAAVYVICRLVWSAASGTPAPGRSWFRAALAVIGSLSLMHMAWNFAQEQTGTTRIVLSILVPVLILTSLWGCLDGSNRGVWVFWGSAFASYMIPLEDIAEKLARRFVHQGWLVGLIVCSSLVFSIFCVWRVFLILRSWLGIDKSVLDSSPLRKSILDVINCSRFEIPAFVTVAQRVSIFDPDSPGWYTWDRDARGMPMDGARYHPETFNKWHARYVDLSLLSADEAVEYCAASAAIPFGIVPAVAIGYADYVDGGVADNCPVYPFLDRDDIDEIFIVLLSPHRTDDCALRAAGATLGLWQKRHRGMEVVEFPIPGDFQDAKKPYKDWNKPPKVIPYRTPKPFPNCVPFYPSRSLGNFLSGTLNFKGTFARLAIRRGYADARHRLKTLSYWDRGG